MRKMVSARSKPPSGKPALGMYWNGTFYIDTHLPFGSRSFPYIFNTFADALAWILIYVCF